MKLFGAALLFLTLSTGCARSYFKSSNDVYKKESVVYMADGTQKKGLITVDFENTESKFAHKDYIAFIPDSQKTDERLYLGSIKGYSVNGEYFALKLIDLQNTIFDFGSSPSPLTTYLFVKPLNGEDSKMRLYELHRTRKSSPYDEESYYYFMALPGYGYYQTVPMTNYLSNFDVKMSRIVMDCPALVNKILAKTKGYYVVPMGFSDKKRLDVYMRIADEYNHCN
ncbi:MAG: hypothetical protein C5B59_15500 [Bacteroidetes bacterium]|nr:MAG: hypothetical protein C5B59_15500 [Bacteroidota bacterium]